MNTTGRSERINSFFDAFVTSTTNLIEFVDKYEQALKKIMEKESNEDFKSEQKYGIVTKLYTRNAFNKFKDEWSQFMGIPCRHILKVFVRLDIDLIPDHFTLSRWKQEANKFRIMDSKYLG
ncbi:hypothetical protein KPL71_001363 [Citrus sinensis]|uniref:Uncharacterized protein n=1 Tax=Citrus sinensis TaxID=2711 RepID=A0ACB8NVY3_CITSI|nr:hypothetical protein KPL71_001363 [Citrus sinensis]